MRHNRTHNIIIVNRDHVELYSPWTISALVLSVIHQSTLDTRLSRPDRNLQLFTGMYAERKTT